MGKRVRHLVAQLLRLKPGAPLTPCPFFSPTSVIGPRSLSKIEMNTQRRRALDGSGRPLRSNQCLPVLEKRG